MILESVTIQGNALPKPWYALGVVGDWFIWLTFVAEVVAMLSVVPDRRAWLRAHVLDVAIVVLTPPVAPTVLQSASGY